MVMGAAVVGAMVMGAIVGAIVVGATVMGAIVGAMVVGAMVMGAIVGAMVVGAMVTGAEVIGAMVAGLSSGMIICAFASGISSSINENSPDAALPGAATAASLCTCAGMGDGLYASSLADTGFRDLSLKKRSTMPPMDRLCNSACLSGSCDTTLWG